jgi:hypothetical protein
MKHAPVGAEDRDAATFLGSDLLDLASGRQSHLSPIAYDMCADSADAKFRATGKGQEREADKKYSHEITPVGGRRMAQKILARSGDPFQSR